MAAATDRDIKRALAGTCTPSALFGHWFKDGKCTECGMLKDKFVQLWGKKGTAS